MSPGHKSALVEDSVWTNRAPQACCQEAFSPGTLLHYTLLLSLGGGLMPWCSEELPQSQIQGSVILSMLWIQLWDCRGGTCPLRGRMVLVLCLLADCPLCQLLWATVQTLATPGQMDRPMAKRTARWEMRCSSLLSDTLCDGGHVRLAH